MKFEEWLFVGNGQILLGGIIIIIGVAVCVIGLIIILNGIDFYNHLLNPPK